MVLGSGRHTGRQPSTAVDATRGDERPGSDIDFLVELEPDARPFEILSIGVELDEALGVKVDVGTPESLRERLRDEVLAEVLPLRAARTRLGCTTSSVPSTRSEVTLTTNSIHSSTRCAP
ncbi:MAG: nucleotidyltransferase domain-containing protein [Acidimicrobiales bacterium]|nr:nucleotidyltransferase domain-containing protein [Acidimicrobiales bacterium]